MYALMKSLCCKAEGLMQGQQRGVCIVWVKQRTKAASASALVLREGLGCCCGMILTASDSSRKDSRRGERASSALLTTLHSLHAQQSSYGQKSA